MLQHTVYTWELSHSTRERWCHLPPKPKSPTADCEVKTLLIDDTVHNTCSYCSSRLKSTNNRLEPSVFYRIKKASFVVEIFNFQVAEI